MLPVVDPGGVDPGGVYPGDIDPGGVDPGDIDPDGVDPGCSLRKARMIACGRTVALVVRAQDR